MDTRDLILQIICELYSDLEISVRDFKEKKDVLQRLKGLKMQLEFWHELLVMYDDFYERQ